MFSGGMEMKRWLKIGKVILNIFLNGYLIFIWSYPQAELCSVRFQYAVNGTWTYKF